MNNSNPRLALFSFNVVLPGLASSVPAGVLIENEKIVSIITREDFELDFSYASVSSRYPGYKWEDYSDYFISPGLVDINATLGGQCDYREDTIEYEGSTQSESSSCLTSYANEAWEGYELGTRSALYGGTTTVIETPNSPIRTASDFLDKVSHLKETPLYCDIGLLAQATPNSLSELPRLSEAGVFGFKGYLIPQGKDSEVFPVQDLASLFACLSELDRPALFHPELTNERFLYMSSPFRKVQIEERQHVEEPLISMFAAAVPEEIIPTSSECTPLFSSPSPNKESMLNQIYREQHNNHISLIRAEIKAYENSGPTVYQLSPFSSSPSPIKDIPSIERFNAVSPETKDPEKVLSQIQLIQGNPLESIQASTPDKFLARTNKTLPTIEESPLESKMEIARENSPKKDSGKSGLELKQDLPTKPGGRRPPPISTVKIQPVDENKDYSTVLANSSSHWEESGINALIENLTNFPSCRVHISNLSSANAVIALKKLKTQLPSLNVTCETASFYLHFSEQNIGMGDTRFKVCPPIREETNKIYLNQVFNLGCIDVVASFHRPIKAVHKCLQSGNFKRAVPGISSIGFNLQTAWNAIGGDPKTAAVKLALCLSTNPAKVVGLEEKGSIAVGKHADFVVWSPYEDTDEPNFAVCNPKVSPFFGEKLPGKVVRTYLRGVEVYNGETFTPIGAVLSKS